jgi:hypothetical protein
MSASGTFGCFRRGTTCPIVFSNGCHWNFLYQFLKGPRLAGERRTMAGTITQPTLNDSGLFICCSVLVDCVARRSGGWHEIDEPTLKPAFLMLPGKARTVRLPVPVHHRCTSLDFPMRSVFPSPTDRHGISRLARCRLWSRVLYSYWGF